mgnify:CR=1 FL=1
MAGPRPASRTAKALRPPDRVLPGIAMMAGFTAIVPASDVFAKLAAATLPIGVILLARFTVQAAVLIPLAAFGNHLARPAAHELAAHFLRAALILGATGALYTALRFMPLADAIAIFFVEPFILTLLGSALLGEGVGWRRLAACGAGFAGALLIIRPSFAVFGPVALLPLMTALFFAFYMVLTRRISHRMHPIALQGWTALAAMALMTMLLAVFRGSGAAPLEPVMPAGREWLWLAGLGCLSALAHLLVSYALRFAPAATIAPLQYLEIVMATLLGFAVFGDLPDLQTVAGIAIIVASGLYVFQRERRT